MLGMVIRFVVSAVVLLVLSAILPGFAIRGFWNALLAAVVIALAGFAIESVLGERNSQYARGIVGFIVGAVVIWGAQFVVPTMHVSILGALLASLIIGLVDTFVPTELR
ncbi:MAG: phage holin family protein [Bacillota bacterium]|nr:phage holin family protein [Bacillota bacterium]